MENFGRQWNLDRIILTNILKYFRTNRYKKRRNIFKIEKFVVLPENFSEQTDCSRYRRKISQSRRSPSTRNKSYLHFLIKQMETMQPGHQQSAISERHWRSTLHFTEIVNNYGLKRGTACQIMWFISQFSLKLYI